MAKVTSKFQLTVPKLIADQYDIRVGDELEWVPAGETIRVIPPGRHPGNEACLSVTEKLELFDKATERQRRRNRSLKLKPDGGNRGWRRQDLYTRGLPR